MQNRDSTTAVSSLFPASMRSLNLLSVPLLTIAAAVSLAYSSPAQAVAVGTLQSWQAPAAQANRVLTLHTDQGHQLRISLIQDGIFRVEAAWKGDWSSVKPQSTPIVLPQTATAEAVNLRDQGEYLLWESARFALRIYKKPLKLALYQAGNQQRIWEELQPLDLGEKQSYQTLSSKAGEAFWGGGQQNGQFAFQGKQLDISYSGGWEEGDRPNPAPVFISSQGYAVLRNTFAPGVYDFRQQNYLTASHQERGFDAYYMVGGLHDALRQYTALTGRVPLLPRWALEYGDADCYNDGDNRKKPGTVPAGWSDGPTGTTPDVVQSVAAQYRKHDMPGGWILPNDGYGCGYTGLPETVKGLKQYGFRTGLWTENGVDKIQWEVGTAGTRAQKLDVAWTGKGYQFAMDANHAAANGILSASDSRPFVWTVMGWAGVQRYAVTWTGDQSGSWDYIRWHIPTLIGSGLSGQAYATGDVDGIFGGSPETYTRDLQWKTFTPVLMGMSGWSKAERKHPWWFDEPYRSINRRYLKLKMRLIPYMYTLVREAQQTGAPPVRGLMWDHPQDAHAMDERYRYQFFLGRDLLVAPVYKSQAASRGWRRDIYLPQGEWIDYWDGRVVQAGAAGRLIDQQVTLDRLPVMVRAGAILPMYPESLYDGQKPKDRLTLDIYPKGSSQFDLYEDDGETRQFEKGAFSHQKIRVDAPSQGAGKVQIQVGAVTGSYHGQETQRALSLQVHTRALPQQVMQNGKVLAQLDAAQAQAGQSGWWYAADERYGTVHVQTAALDIRQAQEFTLDIAAGTQLTATADYPAAPALGETIPPDALLVISRPAEEPGHPLENAFDGKPETWFRTVRDQAQKTGAHEFTLALGERRMVKGIEITGRTDQHWEYGQPKAIEIYVGDSNGEWGKPVFSGQLKKQKEKQQVTFTPVAGRLLRLRILSTHDQNDDGVAADPMILNASGNADQAKAVNAQIPKTVAPVTISEFAVLEAAAPQKPALQLALNTLPVSGGKVLPVPQISMNGLQFRQGLQMTGNASQRYTLNGNWQWFRADVGIDDRCSAHSGVQFRIFGDGRLLFSSGLIKAPAVVKPELDVRGVRELELRTVSSDKAAASACANWANAMLTGYEGDSASRKD